MNPDTKPLIQSDANVTQPAFAGRTGTHRTVLRGNAAHNGLHNSSASTEAAYKKRSGLMGLLLVGMLVLGMLLGGAGAGAVMLVGNAVNPPVASAPVRLILPPRPEPGRPP